MPPPPTRTVACLGTNDLPVRVRQASIGTVTVVTATKAAFWSSSSSSSPSGLSAGAIAGIIIGSVAGILLLWLLGSCCMNRRCCTAWYQDVEPYSPHRNRHHHHRRHNSKRYYFDGNRVPPSRRHHRPAIVAEPVRVAVRSRSRRRTGSKLRAHFGS